MTRRDAGWLILQAASAAGSSGLFASWMRAAQPSAHAHNARHDAPPDPHDWANYKPRFFSAEEFRNLDALIAVLIPTDDTPGAREAYVAPFIDFVVEAAKEYAPEIQARWREAIAWVVSQRFAELAANRQTELLTQISTPERDPAQPRDTDGFRAYKLIKDMTVHAFYTSRVGLVDVLQYKGLAYLTEFPACTHPEHRRV